uniref:Ribosomal protein S3 n=1 Tax=Sheathia arcuata TaxID=340433 RepID=A0A1Z1XA74_9FLOR|nr:ribosomal protein S3 [Sheathia arcuata]ARX95742.1 ribosomal protein S3 [Sheathia arcuata]
MSQKINPISFRLGLSQVWNNTFQLYGKNLSSYTSFLYLKLVLYNYLRRYLDSKQVFFGPLHWLVLKDKIILLVIYRSCFNSNLLKLEKLTLFLRFLTNWNLKLYLLKQMSWVNTPALITAYILYNRKKKISLKIILKRVTFVLSSCLNSKKIVYNSKGPISLRLKGFKIKISGRFDNTRNQMSKTLSNSEGSLPLSKLNSYMEYHNSEIYTNSGLNNLQVWLFYTI